MKKTKLLTSVAALALVLSLGACNQPEDDSTGSEETSSETSSSSSSTSTEQEKVTLTNYTLSITLKDEAGEPVVIPFYDSVYICGSWDSWAEWTVLTDIGDETESVLTTTFASIEEGTYNFKGVVGGQDETPSWNLTELIVSSTGGDVSFEVNAEDGDNYTNNLEFTVDATKVPVLEETPMDDETIAGLILAQVSEIYEEPWEAIHGYSKEDEEMSVEVWYASDEEGGTYGKAIWYDDEDGNETRYIVGETQYIIDGDGEYSTQTYSNDYEDEFDTYAVATDTLGSAEASAATIAHEEGSSIYTLTVVDDDTTDIAVAQRAGDTFTIISVSSSDDGDVYSAEKIDAAAVEALMADFSTVDWGIASNPADLIDLANITGNYTLTLSIDEYVSTETISVSDYYGGNYDIDELADTLTYYGSGYDMVVSYTEDALLIDYYYNFYGYQILVEEDLYVNSTYEIYGFTMPCCDCYFTEDGENWYYYVSYVPYEWQDIFYSLFDASYFGLDQASAYILSQSGTDSEGNYVDLYTVGSAYTALYLVDVLGGYDFWYGTYSSSYASYVWMGGIYFYPELQTMDVNIGVGYFAYADDDKSTVMLVRDNFYASVTDVGTTDISELVSYVEENAVEYEDEE